MKLHALSITRWKHADASIKDPVHLAFAVDLSQVPTVPVHSNVRPNSE